MRPDFLRRLVPTNLVADLSLMGRTVRLETDDPAIFERTCNALQRCGRVPPGRHDFLWRLVGEPDGGARGPRPAPAVFSDGPLSLVQIGQRTFIAVDQEAHEAVGFVEETLTKDEAGFERLFLSTLIELTARAFEANPERLAATQLAKSGEW